MSPPIDLTARLRALLDERGLTVAEVAKDAGMSKQQLHAILSRPAANPSFRTIERIVEAVGGTFHELLCDGEDDPD